MIGFRGHLSFTGVGLIILPEKNKPGSKHGVDKIACFI